MHGACNITLEKVKLDKDFTSMKEPVELFFRIIIVMIMIIGISNNNKN